MRTSLEAYGGVMMSKSIFTVSEYNLSIGRAAFVSFQTGSTAAIIIVGATNKYYKSRGIVIIYGKLFNSSRH